MVTVLHNKELSCILIKAIYQESTNQRYEYNMG